MPNHKFVGLKPYRKSRFRKSHNEKHFGLSVEEANHYLYNDLPLPEFNVEDKWISNVKTLIDKNEKFADIGSTLGCHYLTNKGKLINAKTPKFMTLVKETSRNHGTRLYFMIDKNRAHLPDLFKKFKWEYDQDKIIDYLEKNDYPMRVVNYIPTSKKYNYPTSSSERLI